MNLYILIINFFKNIFGKSKLTLASIVAPDLTSDISNAHVVRNSQGRPVYIRIMVNGRYLAEAFTDNLDNELKSILSNQLYTTDELTAENYIDFYEDNKELIEAVDRKNAKKMQPKINQSFN